MVCVDGTFPDAIKKLYRELPQEGKTYTVRAVYLGRGKLAPSKPGASDGEVGVLLAEINNTGLPFKLNTTGDEPGFNAVRFRPLDELDTENVEEFEDELVGAH